MTEQEYTLRRDRLRDAIRIAARELEELMQELKELQESTEFGQKESD